MAIHVRIYRPTRTATQQGGAKTHEWAVEFVPGERRVPEPLMGWISSGDTRRQVQLRFPTEEEAIAYAKRNGFSYAVEEPKAKTIRPKSYAANFAWNRVR